MDRTAEQICAQVGVRIAGGGDGGDFELVEVRSNGDKVVFNAGDSSIGTLVWPHSKLYVCYPEDVPLLVGWVVTLGHFRNRTDRNCRPCLANRLRCIHSVPNSWRITLPYSTTISSWPPICTNSFTMFVAGRIRAPLNAGISSRYAQDWSVGVWRAADWPLSGHIESGPVARSVRPGAPLGDHTDRDQSIDSLAHYRCAQTDKNRTAVSKIYSRDNFVHRHCQI